MKKSSKKSLAKIKEPNFEYYDRFEIQVEAIQVKELSRWAYKVSLYQHKQEKVKKFDYICDELCKSEKEAVTKGFEHGKKLVDEKNKGRK